jgi:hypothetical protein
MKALAVLAACLALGAAPPSYAAAIMMVPHHAGPQPHVGPQPHALPTPAPPFSHHGRNDETDIGYPQDVPNDTPATDAATDEPFILPSAERCPAAEPVVVRSSGPHIYYIGQKPPVQANLPKVIYGTD